MLTVAEAEKCNLSQYDCIGFASGIYMGKFHASIFRFLDSRRNAVPQNAFVVSTSGSGNG